MHNTLVSLFSVFAGVSVYASVPHHQPTAAEALRTLQINRHADSTLDSVERANVQRPYAEYEKAKYVFFDDEYRLGSGAIKNGIAKNLPSDVTLIVMGRTREAADEARTRFEKWLPGDRLKTLVVPEGETFWSRDTVPVPVFLEDGSVGLVETRHRGGEMIAPKVLELFPVPLVSSKFDYPGGNFMADTNGNCFQVESVRGFLSESALKKMYGCKNVVTFPHEHGLGDIDEAAKVVSPTKVLVDEPSYDSAFEELGYEVVRLPRPSGNPKGTYVNSLMVNDTVFLPVYGVPEDKAAIAAYREAGFKVYPHSSNELSSKGYGSIHCMTMSYPDVR